MWLNPILFVWIIGVTSHLHRTTLTILIFSRIMLNINVGIASKIVALRPAIEALIVRSTQNPDSIANRPESVEQLCQLIRLLSDQQLEHVLCEKIIEKDETAQSDTPSFNQPPSDYQSNAFFSTNRGYRPRSFHGRHNRPFHRGYNSYQQSYRPQNK